MICAMRGAGENVYSALRRVQSHKSDFLRSHQVGFVPLIFTLSVSAFLITFFSSSPVLMTVRAVTGVIAILVIPGVLLASMLLPEKVANPGTTLVAGLVFQLLAIQLLYLLNLLLGASIDLVIWMVLVNSLLVITGSLFIYTRQIRKPFDKTLGWSYGVPLSAIVVVAFVIRSLLLVFAEGSLSPDSALYADFARGIMEGNFQSSVSNDGGVFQLTSSVDYVIHHAFTYVYAVSWLLISPSVQGPTAILIIIGVLVVFFAFLLAQEIFGSKAATWIAAVVSVHPLFVFHSVVGYGPEITSLLLILCLGFFLLNGVQESCALAIVTGLLIGLVDLLWYPNFYSLCVLLLVLFLSTRNRHEDFNTGAFILFPVVLAARVYYLNIVLFVSIWILVFALFFAIMPRPETRMHERNGFILFGVFLTIILWRLPVQIRVTLENLSTSFATPSPFDIMLSTASIVNKIPSFTFFALFHVTPVLMALILFTVWKRSTDRVTSVLVILAVVSFLGTLFVLSRTPASFEMRYLFSDSRFFLLPVFLMILSLGSLLSRIDSGFWRRDTNSEVKVRKKFKRRLIIAGLILLGFTPAYTAIPSGLALIDMEERYGWKNLTDAMEQFGDDNSVFLVNRAREFSWFTGRRSAYLHLSQEGLNSLNASREISSLFANFNAEFLLMDEYTVIKWKTFEYLVFDPILLGKSVALNISETLQHQASNLTSSTLALTLEAETEPTDLGRKARLYRIESVVFNRTLVVDLLDSGWSANNEGRIENSTGTAEITIAAGKETTTVFRTGSHDLDLPLETGYLIIKLEETGATVDQIQFLDENGDFLQFAEELSPGMFFCQMGDVVIGDIQITISGTPGSSVAVDSIAVWHPV